MEWNKYHYIHDHRSWDHCITDQTAYPAAARHADRVKKLGMAALGVGYFCIFEAMLIAWFAGVI